MAGKDKIREDFTIVIVRCAHCGSTATRAGFTESGAHLQTGTIRKYEFTSDHICDAAAGHTPWP